MPANTGTAEGRFLIEIDGITAIRASEFSGLGFKHTPVKIHEGNRPNPNIVRGNYEVNEASFKHASAVNQTGREYLDWMEGFARGQNTERRGCRVIVLDEAGQSPVDIYDLQDCAPTEFMVESHSASGTNGSFFTFKLMPEDFRRY
jgi:phage tail-like protein